MARQSKKTFISYSHNDEEFALQLANDLRLEEVNTWIAKLDIAAGKKWDHAIEEALKFCKDFLVILSPNSINSDNVRDEINFAVQEKKRIFPVLHKKCEIPFRLRRIEYSDFTSDYDSGLKHLVKAIKSAVLENLPDKDIDFIGREDEIKRVHEGLKSHYNIIAIDGIGGIGKTSLALEVAHECLVASQNPTFAYNDVQKFEAFIWTTARDRELIINDMLDIIAQKLEYSHLTQLPLEEKRHKVVKHLQEKRCLLIVDNFETVTDNAVHDFILALPKPNKCLITNRSQNLEKAWSVSLRGLTKEDALLLIKNEGERLGINLDAFVTDGRKFQRLYEATGGAPLAIQWSIGQIKQRGQSIEGVLNSLYYASGNARVDIFERMFQRAWSFLSEASIKILMVVPIFASSASKAAIEAASDVHKWELDQGLGQLVELWLLEANERLDEDKRRYSLHPLTRAFAQNKLSEHPDLEKGAKLRLVNFLEYFSISAGGDTMVWKNYDESELEYDKIELEKDNIFALTDWCFKNHLEMEGMKLTRAVTYFMGLRGYFSESLKFGRSAAEAARRANKHNDFAWLLVHGIGWREIHGGDLKIGESHFIEALQIYENLNDKRGIMVALSHLGRALLYKNDFNSARQYYEQGFALANSLDDKFEIAVYIKEFAMLDLFEGRLQEAKGKLESVLDILKKNNQLVYATALGDLAEVYNRLKDYENAYRYGIESLDLAKKMKRRDTTGWVSLTLAFTEEARGNYQAAKNYAKHALDFFDQPGLSFNEIVKELNSLLSRLG